MGINGIPSCTSYWACNHPVFTKNRINQARFPDIWTANQAKFNQIWVFFFCFNWKIFDDGIKYITGSNPMDRGYWKGLTQSQGIKIIDVIAHLWIIDFIYCQDNRFMSLVENTSDIFIGICDPFFTRNDKDDHICFIHGNFCLMFDLLHKWGIHIINSSSINDTKFSV